jgi:PAS domain S-box-containing protein
VGSRCLAKTPALGCWLLVVGFGLWALELSALDSRLPAPDFLLNCFFPPYFSRSCPRLEARIALKSLPFGAEVISRMSTSSYVLLERQKPETLQGLLCSPVPMWIFDRRTLAILEVNEAATEAYGYSRSEFLKMTILDFRPSEDIPKVLQSALRAPGSRPLEPVWRHLKKDGTVFQAKVVSWEITFDGHQAALVLAEAVRSASAQN